MTKRKTFAITQLKTTTTTKSEDAYTLVQLKVLSGTLVCAVLRDCEV